MILVKTVKGVTEDAWGNELPVNVITDFRNINKTDRTLDLIVSGGDGRTSEVPVWEDLQGIQYVQPPNVEGRSNGVFKSLATMVTPSVFWRSVWSFTARDRLMVWGGPPIHLAEWDENSLLVYLTICYENGTLTS